MKDNKHLLTGYRIGFQGVKNGFKTMFMCHNETENVWSHFIGKLFFLGLFFWILTCWPQMRSQADTFEAQVTELLSNSSFEIELYLLHKIETSTLDDIHTVEGIAKVIVEMA